MTKPARKNKSRQPKRLTGADRQAQIVAAGARLFAEHGFDVSTRELAGHLGVTQALLYRYFASKQALVDAVFEAQFVDRWDPAIGDVLTDRGQTLTARLTAFYQRFAERFEDVPMRLFMRAALDGMKFPHRYSFPLNQRVLEPVVGELRHEAKLPPLAKKPMTRGERELALALHGSIVFLGIRRHLYRMPLPKDLDRHVGMHVAIFTAGAVAEIKSLNKLPADDVFAPPMVGRRKR